MITPTNYTTDKSLLLKACDSLYTDKMKTSINRPIGDFFYDPWIIKDEYVGTIWEKLYNSLPVADKGEARIIILNSGHCYQSHADIDDRYHLNISGNEIFLINLIQEQMYRLEQDGIWYDMDAGFHHTAVNFGELHRVQLVVRKLLKRNNIENPLEVTIKTKLEDLDLARYKFDNQISPWLNSANKNGYISNFKYSPNEVKFTMEEHQLTQLKNYLQEEFEIVC